MPKDPCARVKGDVEKSYLVASMLKALHFKLLGRRVQPHRKVRVKCQIFLVTEKLVYNLGLTRSTSVLRID